MKNNDKVTLTVGQLKKLVKESKSKYDTSWSIDELVDFIMRTFNNSRLANKLCKCIDCATIDPRMFEDPEFKTKLAKAISDRTLEEWNENF